MNLSENAIKVLKTRYLTKDQEGNIIETPEELFRRVAKAIAAADENYFGSDIPFESKRLNLKGIEDEFYEMMANLEFLPNSPTLMNAGRPLGQLSACFVLPIEDSMEGIFDSIKNAALIHKSGGGTGFSFSRLRPRNSTVKSTGGVASGPVSFMKVFNSATEAVKQGGTRRGANMGVLRVDHPDIMEFIQCKANNADITNFNISVGLTEAFMKAAKIGAMYDLIDPKTKEVVQQLNAKEIYDLIIDMAWKNGEPGILFLDRINKKNITPDLGEIEATNPCGEQPLLPYEACNLGSINLLSVYDTRDARVDYQKLKRIVHKAVHFLDNVIDVNNYPIPEIDAMTRGTRKIGLGIMGWANLLCKLGIPYNSDQGVALGAEIMEFIQNESTKASIDLAYVRGAFPYFDKSIYKNDPVPRRNAATTTIAPTGTLSMIANVSSGCEPLFAISWIKNVMDGQELYYVDPSFEEDYLAETGLKSTSKKYKDLLKKISETGTVAHIDNVPENIKKSYVTAHDISPEWHVKMQAAFQRHVESAVSKTVNLCNTATREDVKAVYDLAYELNCKGVTIYRDGSRDLQVLNVGEVKGKEKPAETIKDPDEFITPRIRPETVHGLTRKWKIGCGNLYVTVNYDDKGICEIFTNLGRGGGCPSQSEASSRLASVSLRAGLDPKVIIEQLKGIRCSSTIRQKSKNPEIQVMSCPDAIGKTIEMAIYEMGINRIHPATVAEQEAAPVKIQEMQTPCGGDCMSCTAGCEPDQSNTKKKDSVCPECKQPVEHEGGCMICRHCGFSKCG